MSRRTIRATIFERKNLKSMVIESYCCGPVKSALLLLRVSLDSLHAAIACGTRAALREAARFFVDQGNRVAGFHGTFSVRTPSVADTPDLFSLLEA